MENELIQLYNNSHLPKEGWIQGCFHCSLKTSLLIDIMTEKSYKHKKKYLFQCFYVKIVDEHFQEMTFCTIIL